jgi:arabinose-5-phosphate isomerase
MKKVVYIKNEQVKAISNIPDQEEVFDKVVFEIKTMVHDMGGKLITTGMGKAGIVAKYASAVFSSIGIPSLFLHPGEAQHGDLGVVQKNDTLLVFSNSGKTKEVLELINLVRLLYPEICPPIITVTGQKSSPIVDVSDFILLTGNYKELDPLEVVPTSSFIAMTSIVQILISLMITEIGFTRFEFFKRHHGGYLGSILKGE